MFSSFPCLQTRDLYESLVTRLYRNARTSTNPILRNFSCMHSIRTPICIRTWAAAGLWWIPKCGLTAMRLPRACRAAGGAAPARLASIWSEPSAPALAGPLHSIRIRKMQPGPGGTSAAPPLGAEADDASSSGSAGVIPEDPTLVQQIVSAAREIGHPLPEGGRS